MRYDYDPSFERMLENVMRSANSVQDPAIIFQEADYIGAFHNVYVTHLTGKCQPYTLLHSPSYPSGQPPS